MVEKISKPFWNLLVKTSQIAVTEFIEANGTAGIEHVYVTLTTLWKFFYYSPKHAQSLKEVQKVLDFPELKIVKPSDTRWLAYERCMRAVKASYSAIVTALDHIYSKSHKSEALGI